MAESENTTVARPYARAAFSEALEQSNGLAEWSKMLALLSGVVQQQPVREALDNPRLTWVDEAKLVTDLVGEELSEPGRNFVSALAEYGRIELLPVIQEMFELLKAHHEKTMDVTVSSAFEISADEAAALTDALKKRLQRDVNLSSSVDKDLLGGAIIRTENTVIDYSVRGKLTKLAQALG